MKKNPLEVEHRLEMFKSAAQKRGIKMTPQRLEIFRLVACRKDHPSVEAVFEAVRPIMPTVSLDTIYRTLWLLKDLGLLNTLGPRGQRVHFDANLKPHHHYLCMQCGLIMDFDSVELNNLPIPERVKDFGQIATTRVEVQGLCKNCTKEKAEKFALINKPARNKT